MADQNTDIRPKRSAARVAQEKVEKSYEKWGQPPPDNDARRAAPIRKRSTTAESSAARKRSRTSFQHDKSDSPMIIPKTEPEDDAQIQQVKRGVRRSRKNPVRHQIPAEGDRTTKKITLRVLDSPTFREALRRIWNTEEDAGLSAGSYVTGQAEVVEFVTEGAISNASTEATFSYDTAYAPGGSVLPSDLGPVSAEHPVQSKSRSESSLRDIRDQVPEILQDDPHVDTSILRAETLAANSWEATRLSATQMELEGTSSKSDSVTGRSDHAGWLDQLKAAASVQSQHPRAVSSERALPFNSDHMYRISDPSSLAIQRPSYFASVREPQDRNTSALMQGQQRPMVSEEYATGIPVDGDANAVGQASPQHREPEIRPGGISIITATSSEVQLPDMPRRSTPNVADQVATTLIQIERLALRRKTRSFHPPPMNTRTPKIYFDRHPYGSSVGAHSFDPNVGLPDHSDPRMFHTPNSPDKEYLSHALQPTIDHFRQLTDGVSPRTVTLDFGYDVAHTLLQAHLRLWFVINRPDHAHNKSIPKLFKLERWNGGIEDWKLASNFPVILILPHTRTYNLTSSGSSKSIE